jgi:hypothetical protein
MAKHAYYFQGKCKYPKLVNPDIEYRCWSVQTCLTKKSYEDFMKLKDGSDTVEGILNNVKLGEDGEYWVTFKRPMEKTYKGKSQLFTPPKLLNADGTPFPPSTMIGNGSDITVKVEWYTFQPPFKKKKGSAIRMESVRVDNLVPYEMKKDFSQVELQQVEGLLDQPAPQLF